MIASLLNFLVIVSLFNLRHIVNSAVIRVTTANDIASAVLLAEAGDEIIVATGTYSGPRNVASVSLEAHIATGAAGTEDSPIILRGEDPENPPIISGTDISFWSVIRLVNGANYWRIQDLILIIADKGIVIDASDFVEVRRVEIRNIGEEAIHVRDGSKNTLIEDCRISDTGQFIPDFGEGIYVGSDRSVWDTFAPDVGFTTIRNCQLGPNIKAEAFDIREGTFETTIEYNSVDAAGLSGLNSADSFVDLKGTRAYVRFNTFNRNGAEALTKGVATIYREVELSAYDNVIHDNTFIFGSGVDSIPMVAAGGGSRDTIAFDNIRDPAVGAQYSGDVTQSCCPSWYERPDTLSPSPVPTPIPTTAVATLLPTPNPTSERTRGPTPSPLSSAPTANPTTTALTEGPTLVSTPNPTTTAPTTGTPGNTAGPTSPFLSTPSPALTPSPKTPVPKPTSNPTAQGPSFSPTMSLLASSEVPSVSIPLSPTVVPSIFQSTDPQSSTGVPDLPSFNPSAMPLISPVEPSFVPSLIPTLASQTGGSFCDDSDYGTFTVPSLGELQRCVWLAARPEYVDEVCSTDEGRLVCPELCGVCSDDCVDTDTKFFVGADQRDCLWLNLRPYLKPDLCFPGSDAFLYCPESCNSCDARRPSSAPTPQPTVTPVERGYHCDDDKEQAFFVPDIGEFQHCIWLAARPDYQEELCQPDHPSGAWDICEETCQKCIDLCQDTTGTFQIGTTIRDCLWLSLRPHVQELLCVEGDPTLFLCPETCDACDADKTLAPSPTQISLTLPPSGFCDDSKFDTFYVSDIREFQRCVWLAARPDYQAAFCVEGHPSNARMICSETCGACVDDCVDTNGKFDVGAAVRDCLWLSLRPNLQKEICVREEVKSICPETCDTCDTSTS